MIVPKDLPGVDLTPALTPGFDKPLKDAAFSQITRCYNCTLAYLIAHADQCHWDQKQDQGLGFDLLSLGLSTSNVLLNKAPHVVVVVVVHLLPCQN